MKLIAKILAVLSLAAFSHFPAAAETGPERDGTGLLVGGGPAYVIVNDRCKQLKDPGEKCDDTGIGLQVFANYRMHKNFGVEGGYIWATGYDVEVPLSGGGRGSSDATTSAFYLAGEVAHSFTNGVGIFAKAGVNFWEFKGDCSFCVGPTSYDGTDPLFGVGLEYRNTPVSPLKIRMEWLRLFQKENDTGVQNHDNDVLSLTAGYIF